MDDMGKQTDTSTGSMKMDDTNLLPTDHHNQVIQTFSRFKLAVDVGQKRQQSLIAVFVT